MGEKLMLWVSIAIIVIVVFIAFSKSNKKSEEINEPKEVLETENIDDKKFKSEQLDNEGYSDRELQEEILKTLKLNQKDNEIIKKWVVFWSWLSIIGLAIYFFTLFTILK